MTSSPQLDAVELVDDHQPWSAAPASAVDTCVSLFKSDGLIYLSDSDVSTPLEHAERSQTLAEMPEGEGHSTLPISYEALRLWQESAPCVPFTSAWDLNRIADLCSVAQVCVHPYQNCRALDQVDCWYMYFKLTVCVAW